MKRLFAVLALASLALSAGSVEASAAKRHGHHRMQQMMVMVKGRMAPVFVMMDGHMTPVYFDPGSANGS